MDSLPKYTGGIAAPCIECEVRRNRVNNDDVICSLGGRRSIGYSDGVIERLSLHDGLWTGFRYGEIRWASNFCANRKTFDGRNSIRSCNGLIDDRLSTGCELLYFKGEGNAQSGARFQSRQVAALFGSDGTGEVARRGEEHKLMPERRSWWLINNLHILCCSGRSILDQNFVGHCISCKCKRWTRFLNGESGRSRRNGARTGCIATTGLPVL